MTPRIGFTAEDIERIKLMQIKRSKNKTTIIRRSPIPLKYIPKTCMVCGNTANDNYMCDYHAMKHLY